MGRLRWLVPALLIIGWLVVAAFGGPFPGKLSDVAENDEASFLPESAESTEVIELQKQFAEQEAVPAIVLAERAEGLTEEDQDFLADTRRAVASAAGVGQEVSPVLPAEDGAAAQFVAPLIGDPEAPVEELRRLTEENRPAGLDVYVTGPAGQIADLIEAFGGIDGLLLIVAGAVVAVILVVVYRSPLLPVLVLISAVTALALASLIVYFLADSGTLTLDGEGQGILFILVFGAATDYALLLVSRFREQLRDTDSPVAAMLQAWRGTVEPILASGSTVILGVLCLLVSDLRSNQGLGPVAAIGIGASLLVSLTFLPAMLVLFGRVAFWPFRPVLGSPHPETTGVWGRVSGFVGRRPRSIWIGTAVVLLAGVAFIPQLKASGTEQSEIFLTRVESVAGQEALDRHFPGGMGSPTIVIAREDAADAVVAATRQVDGVTSADPSDSADGLVEIEAVLAAPPDSDQAVDTVQQIRNAVHAVPDAEAKVGGDTAITFDTRETSERDRALIMPIVLAVVFAVLALLLRALLAPLLLIATVVLSFAATMGVSALVFNHVFHFPGSDPVVPLFGFVFLVALGIDYNIFLMTRVREETVERGTRAGTLHGLMVTGGVITSAGVVLAATFSALAVLPILFLAQIAFIVAFGVLLDTLIVRSLLVPALTVEVGKKVWWPSRLAR